jgi:hypothetical protein
VPSAVDATPEIVTLLALRRMGTVTGDLRLRRRIYRRRKRIPDRHTDDLFVGVQVDEL